MERAVARGVLTQISRSHLQRILQAGDMRPHRVQQWLHSTDPDFREKVNVICELYRAPPPGTVVLERYAAAFRTHTGRWESLPGQGTRTEMAELLVNLLQPYLHRTIIKSI